MADMNKEQLRAMREILTSAAYGAAFPKIATPLLEELVGHGWIEKTGDTYKSTRAGRQAVLAVGNKR